MEKGNFGTKLEDDAFLMSKVEHKLEHVLDFLKSHMGLFKLVDYFWELDEEKTFQCLKVRASSIFLFFHLDCHLSAE